MARLTIVGALLLGGGMGLVASASRPFRPGIAALLIALMPVWFAILGGVFLGERLPRLAVAGIALGFAGVGILVGPSASAARHARPGRARGHPVSPIGWALGSLYSSHRAPLPQDPLSPPGARCSPAAVVLVLRPADGRIGRFHPARSRRRRSLAFAYLTVVGSLLAFTAYVWLLGVAPLPLIATYAYVNPSSRSSSGRSSSRSRSTPRTIVAGGVIIVAVALIVTARGADERRPRSTRTGRGRGHALRQHRPARPAGQAP